MKSYCAYCGWLLRRCQCQRAGSALNQFRQRGKRACPPRARSRPYKRAVPPQKKRRERAALRANYRAWYSQLAAAGACCANCGAAEPLVLDHIIPLAKGGLSRLDNLQLLCAECNRIKGKLVIDCRE